MPLKSIKKLSGAFYRSYYIEGQILEKKNCPWNEIWLQEFQIDFSLIIS